MSQVVLQRDDIDPFVRARIDTVLVGKGSKSPVTLHIPDGVGATETVCPYRTHREGGWRVKDISIFPEQNHDFCLRCVRERFGVDVEVER